MYKVKGITISFYLQNVWHSMGSLDKGQLNLIQTRLESNLGGVAPRPNKLAHTLAVNAEVVNFLVVLPNLTASNFAAL